MIMNNSLLYLYSKIIKILHWKSIKKSKLHKTSYVGYGSNFISSEIGRCSYIGDDCVCQNTIIGQFCSIADHVYIGGSEHPLDWVSTSPAFENVKNSAPPFRYSVHDIEPVKITHVGNDVWIGHGVIIKAGISIGDGAIIGAGAIVTKNVPQYSIVAGVPAKIIRYRFNSNIIEDLLKIEWWSLNDEELMKVSSYIKEPLEFINQVKKIRSSK